MESKRRRLPAGIASLLAAMTLMFAGCAGATGGSLTLFPAGQPLLRTAKEMRDAAPRDAPLPRELSKSVLAAYIVEPGDVLLIETEDFDSPVRLPGDQTVLADGTIDLNRFGRPVVAGHTLEEIEAIVESAVKNEEPDAGPINVRLVNPQSKVFYVLGEVNAPGAYPLIGRETALDAIVTAGGLSNRAEPCKIILSRPSEPHGCRTVLPVCYRQIVQLGDTTTNYQIMPGDRIYVATRPFLHDIFPFLYKKDCGDVCANLHFPCYDYGDCNECFDGVITEPAEAGAAAESHAVQKPNLLQVP